LSLIRNRRRSVAALAGLLAGCAVLAPANSATASDSPAGNWSMGGQNLSNTKFNPSTYGISPSTAHTLAVKWTLTMHGDTSATPAVVGNAVYIPDWGGYLNKINARTGALIWSRRVSDYNGIPGSISRTSPAVIDGVVYIADQNATNGGSGAHLMAVDAETGDLDWITTLDTHFTAVITAAPVVHDGVVYIGVASKEEAAATLPGYPCCTFRGSAVAVDAATGKIRWKSYMVPDDGGKPGGWSGGGIWNVTPALDPRSHTLYVTTGNNYSVPQSVTDCQNAGGTPAECFPPDNRMDSVVALDTDTGAVKWTTGAQAFDQWTLSCLPGMPPNNCPPNPGTDADFGDGPHLFTIPGQDGPRQVLGAGQKNGVYWVLDPATGKVIWSSAVGPGGVHGGMEWGTAVDGRRIYFADANTDHVSYTLPNGQTVQKGGFFGALDAATGKVLWETADPSEDEDMGAVSTAGGVVFAGSMSGHMYALDGATGKILWDYKGEGSSNAAPAIVGDTVYWGNGYDNRFISRLPSTTFYAFSPNGR
jgi:polyvinyl alcohol dehydrogenase (cytochrome)